VTGPRDFGLNLDLDALRAQAVRLLVVFGSWARGTATARSDLDVGVLFGRGEVGLEERAAILGALGSPVEVGLAVLDGADPLLLYEVALDAQPVYEDHPGAFEEFRLLAVKRYWDTAWFRRLEAGALKARLG